MCAEDDPEEENGVEEVRECAVFWDENRICTMLLTTLEHDFTIQLSEEMRNKLIDALMDPLGECPYE